MAFQILVASLISGTESDAESYSYAHKSTQPGLDHKCPNCVISCDKNLFIAGHVARVGQFSPSIRPSVQPASLIFTEELTVNIALTLSPTKKKKKTALPLMELI